VLSTPFHADGGCDPAGLGQLISYARRAGAHGAVYPAIASEFATLDEAERRMMVDVALSACRARGCRWWLAFPPRAPRDRAAWRNRRWQAARQR
jgi:hypothetical protein